MKLAKVFSFFVSFCTIVLFMGAGTQMYATTHTINFSATGFSPSSLNVSTGDTIVWSGNFYYYFIQSTSVPSGANTFGPTTITTTSLSYIVSVAGTYDYEDNVTYNTGSFTATSPAKKGVTLSTSSLDFGSLRVGSSKSLTMTVNSVGPDASLTISSSPLTIGTNYTTSPTSSNRTITVGSSETETITFKPTTRGTLRDTLTINSDATTASDQVKTVVVSGTGINGVFSGATSLAFDKVRVGNSKQQDYTVSNSGDDTLFISAASVTGTGFTISSGLSTSNIPPGGSGTITIQFSPTVKQNYTGSISISALNNVTVPAISISGTGISPIFGVASTTYDMGLTLVGGTLPGSLMVTNTGDDTLNISGVSILNTLQGAKFTLTSSTAFSILPGGNSNINFTYTSSAESVDNAVLVINSDDQAATTNQISLIARSGLPKMSLDTKDTIDFGSVRIGSPGTALLTITNLGTYDLTIQISQFTPSQFSLSGNVTTVPLQGSIQAVMQFTPTAAGLVTGMAVIQSNDAHNGIDTIYFKGVGINSALDIPSSVNFRQVNLTKTLDSVLTFKNLGTASAKIFGYKLNDPNKGFILIDTSAHSIAANDSILVKIRFAPTLSQNYSATLNIITDDAVPSRQITLTGEGIDSKLSTAPSLVDFGEIDTGTSVSKTFTITNNGTAQATITALTKTGDASFSLGSQEIPLTIDAGASKDISVSFSPKSAGTFNGIVTITASEGSPISVNLLGKGKVEVVVGSVKSMATDAGLSMTVNPDPSYGTATIRLVMDKPLDISLILFDVTGKLVHTYEHAIFGSGEYSIPLSTEPLPTGEYFLRAITDGSIVAVTKIMILR